MIAEKEKNGFKASLAYIFSRNPVLVLGLVIGQLAAGDTTLKNGVALSITYLLITVPVLVFASVIGKKLPDWFKIPTPLGSYNPDWAVLIEKDGEQKLYFVLETKGNTQIDMLRPAEFDKIACGHKHFEAIGSDMVVDAIDDFKEFIENV